MWKAKPVAIACSLEKPKKIKTKAQAPSVVPKPKNP